jgi:Ni/Fe-hydrogenase subunit HybB-like protein
LYLASVISLFGFITNRLNVSVIGFETYVGHHYVPKWTEFSVTLMIVAMGFALFRLAVQYLPIFPKEELVSEQLDAELLAKVKTVTSPAVPALENAGN